MKTSYETLEVEYEKPTLIVKLNRPDKANAMNSKMSAELDEVLMDLRQSLDCKYVIFTGNGKHFSAGADMAEAGEQLKNDPNFISTIRNDQLGRIDFMRKFDEMDQVSIAAINGPMYGAGFATAMACDFRIMAKTATACLPEAQRGMFFTAGCTGRLVNLVGPAKTKELIMLCEAIDADESKHIGLVNKVAEDSELMEEANKMIQQLEKSPFLPLKMTKKIVNASTPISGNTVMYESDLLELIFMKSDMQRSMASFSSKK
ncbi:enoyl-CoA hydratase/isomerase family protein [Sporosarcina sp. BI001-red]|uniref:enoyl-CoA hydratase/isomerase family protein n=1 Tax=Sporosarcina sp. BI001-red TaxID=2282866 RepID=UPI000E24E640|nr:enoyl-CoA hydratase/isomerase family protein [Sporosarcina sp. BI001-red]REB08747.1 enoyl-CoA hydratase/isomerase family protein [Sporosarcina sp. BI001-red]